MQAALRPGRLVAVLLTGLATFQFQVCLWRTFGGKSVVICIVCCSMYFCVVLCIVRFVSLSVLFVCTCVLNYCHLLATQLQFNCSWVATRWQ